MAEMTPREERRGEREGGRVEELVAGVIGRMAWRAHRWVAMMDDARLNRSGARVLCPRASEREEREGEKRGVRLTGGLWEIMKYFWKRENLQIWIQIQI
jgi:hypothetical protein